MMHRFFYFMFLVSFYCVTGISAQEQSCHSYAEGNVYPQESTVISNAYSSGQSKALSE